ncbi:Golgi phosphoprotein 3 (GPP34) [Bacillus sp. OV322]|uniref:GOLPH3/VPS74 family protein n=1 Tax=Bacillus sp. OV322 TaxID=1882764 RepID=UPI0008DFB727|nr:GPP34 family phosphoprotein [Bacillus sp. OV322]SFC52912.1 Golgi phosphoprotein 3 (GPP34) [Bacillus sp. OV322]
MKDIQISQSFLLLSLNDKGGVSPLGSLRIRAFLIASGILELALEEVILIEDDQVMVKQELPSNKKFLSPIYNEVLAERSLNFKKLARKLVTNRSLFKDMFNSIGDYLVDMDIVTKNSGGILGHSNRYAGGEETKKQIVEQIRAELLEVGTVTKDTIALASLLLGSHILKYYFSEFEEKDLNEKLSELHDEKLNKEIFALVDRISHTITTIIASVG